jgi:hypothetical protein
MFKARWVTRWGHPAVMISRGGDEFLAMSREDAWQLLHELQSLLLTSPVHRPDTDTE